MFSAIRALTSSFTAFGLEFFAQLLKLGVVSHVTGRAVGQHIHRLADFANAVDNPPDLSLPVLLRRDRKNQVAHLVASTSATPSRPRS